MTRHLISLIAAVLVAATSAATLWRARTLLDRELEVLTPQMESLASGWEETKAPLGGRVVTFLLSDARAAFDPFLLAPDQTDGLARRTGDWLGRNLIGGNPDAGTTTALNRAFSDSTSLVGWTHRGLSSYSEAQIARELKKAILKAHDAGAEINIVAQGADAEAVISALKSLQGEERGGAKVGANKVILLGMNRERAARIPGLGAGPDKPGNILELAYVWSTREIGGGIQIQLFDAKRRGETMSLEELWPGLSSGGDNVDKSLRLIRGFLEGPRSLEEMISGQEAATAEARLRKAGERARAAAEDDARLSALAASKPLPVQTLPPAGARSPIPVAAPAPGEARKPASGAGAGPIAARGGWPSGRLFDYSTTMDGAPIGWAFSAPRDMVEDLPKEHQSVSLRVPGLAKERCDGFLSMRAVSARKLGPGDHEAALHQLYENESRIMGTERLPKIAARSAHGRPAGLYRRTRSPEGGAGSKGTDTTRFIVETERHIVFLDLETYFQEAARDACLDASVTIFQGIAESIRPE